MACATASGGWGPRLKGCGSDLIACEMVVQGGALASVTRKKMVEISRENDERKKQKKEKINFLIEFQRKFCPHYMATDGKDNSANVCQY